MRAKKKKVRDRPVYDAIRKPTAPPSKSFGNPKPDEKLYPSRRKTKHKQPEETEQ